MRWTYQIQRTQQIIAPPHRFIHLRAIAVLGWLVSGPPLNKMENHVVTHVQSHRQSQQPLQSLVAGTSILKHPFALSTPGTMLPVVSMMTMQKLIAVLVVLVFRPLLQLQPLRPLREHA
jgi:hypothetical protein